MSDTPRMDNVRHNVAELAVFARQLERELNDANQTNITLLEDREQLRRQLEEANRRNVTLIAERDSARTQADHKWRLREEFEALLGTSDVETGVERVKHLKQALSHVVPRCDRLNHSKGDYHMSAEPCRVEELIRKAQKI